MISLPHLLTTARRFVDGVCAIPRFVPSSELRYEAWQRSFGELNAKLAAEREARETTHERFKQALCGLGVSDIGVARFLVGDEIEGDFVTARDHDIIDQINARQAAERELSVARADLEALTTESINVAWTQARSAWEEGYLIGLQSHEGRSTPGGQPYEAPANPYDLVKPGSLAAWKAQEGGGE